MTDAAPNPSVPPAGATEFDLDHFDQERRRPDPDLGSHARNVGGVKSPPRWLPRPVAVRGRGRRGHRLGDVHIDAGRQHPADALPTFVPLEVDPPDHREYRRILNPAMSPEVANQWEPRVRELAVELLETVRHEREVDLGTAFANPFPKTVALRLIGYPDQDLDRLDNWVEHIVGEHRSATGPPTSRWSSSSTSRSSSRGGASSRARTT